MPGLMVDIASETAVAETTITVVAAGDVVDIPSDINRYALFWNSHSTVHFFLSTTSQPGPFQGIDLEPFERLWMDLKKYGPLVQAPWHITSNSPGQILTLFSIRIPRG